MKSAPKRSSGQTYESRKRERAPLSVWIKPSTKKKIAALGKRWGFGFERDVVEEAIERAHAAK